MDNYLNIAIKAAKAAGNLLKSEISKPVKINLSEEKDIKLQSDIDSERLIINILLKETDIFILGEETGITQNKINNSYKWIVDPLDGSLNYSRSIPINCVSIGLWKGEQPVLGVIYDFIHDNLYTGIIGKGATLNGEKLVTSNIAEKSHAVLLTGFPVYSAFDTNSLSTFIKEIQEYKKLRLLGSAAISLALVSSGAAEAYKEDNIAIWDVAAGIPIVIAAGGDCQILKGDGENLLKVYATNGVLN